MTIAKHEPFGTRMYPLLRKRLHAYCEQSGVKIWAFVDQAVREKLDRCEQKVEHG